MHFTHTQRKAVLFLLAIFTLVIAYQLVRQIMYRPEPFDFSQFDEKFNARRDSIKKVLDQQGASDSSVAITETYEEEIATHANAIININSASLNELTTLPRIGPVIAQRIIDFRNKNGGFASKEDIKKVRGIGKKTYENLKDLISVH